MMTPAQIRLYRASWNTVAQGLRVFGGFSDEEIEAERLQILQAETGRTSSKQLTQRQLDRVLDAHDRAAALVKGPSTSDRAHEQPLKRLIFAIEQLGLPEPYLESIARDQFQTSDWRQLSERQLTRLRYTATSRARTRRKTAAP